MIEQTVAESRRLVAEILLNPWGPSIECPTCDQRVASYPRQVGHVCVRLMAAMYRRGPYAEHHISILAEDHPKFASQGGHATNSHFWGLIVSSGDLREDGGSAGHWSLSEDGIDFLEGRLTIPQFAITYNGKLRGFAGSRVDVEQCIRKHFDLRELIGS